MKVGNKIKYYREKYNITQDELAQKVKKSKQYISKLERDEVNVGVGFAIEVVNAFKLITSEKTYGMQIVRIQVEDLFYLK
jgi:DNA-binding XRE family transcriptional regulator